MIFFSIIKNTNKNKNLLTKFNYINIKKNKIYILKNYFYFKNKILYNKYYFFK